MARLLLTALLLGTTLLPLQAQGWLTLFKKAKPSAESTSVTLGGLSSRQISRQLEQRLTRTYLQAKQAQLALSSDHRMIMGEPIQKVYSSWELNPKELYPNQSFLKNSVQTGDYLAARNNRLFLREIERVQKVWAQIDANLPRLKEEAANTPQPQDPVAWLSQIIPPQTTQLFIGEAHGFNEIHQAVSTLVQNLQTRFPQRKILVFTEFLPEGITWSKKPDLSKIPDYLHKHFSIWDDLLEANISVIGLEMPSAVTDDCVVRYLNDEGALRRQTVWASLEGVRLRNERWQKTLAKYREQFPDALFIVYTGADHVMYNRPFTLAAQKKEKPFVSVLYPDRHGAIESSGRSFFSSGTLVAKPMRGPLERLVDKLDFQRPVVKWQSPDLPAIAGFDVRIKLPVKLKYIDY